MKSFRLLLVMAAVSPLFAQSPSFTSANNTTFELGAPGSFTVIATGSLAPAITESGILPTGMTFTDNGNSTGTLVGTPGQSGTFPITFTAMNGVGLDAVQTFSLIVVAGNAPPSFTSANNTTFALGTPGLFSVTTTGFPPPGITESGPLPAGVTFTDNGNGSGTLSGTPHASGPFSVSFTATSGLGTISQIFTLNVNVGPNLAPSITSGNTKTLVVGTAGSFTVTTNGSPLPAITESAALPIGVTFTDNGNGTATLSGTPVTGGAFPIIITAANGAGPNAVQNFNLNVNGESITSANNTTFALGTPGSFTVTTSGSPTPAITESGALPTGVTFTDNGNGTATLNGTPAAGGPFPIAFTAANGVGMNAVQNFTLTVNQGPSFTSANTATFVRGTPGSFTVTTTGTPAPPIFEQGALPTGVTFVDNGNGSGTLGGTPGSSGIFNIGFSASNSGGKASQTFTLTVNGPNQAPAITSANNATFAVGSPGFFTVTTTGSPLPGITESGLLPTGVTFVDNGNGSGTLSGIPSVGGPFTITFTAANGVGSSATQKFTLTVTGAGNQTPAITSGGAATFSMGTPGSFTVTASGSPLPGITESGGLPAGVTFTDNGNGTGTLAGTTVQSGTFTITFTAANGVGLNAVQTFSLTVLGLGNTPPSFTSANNATFPLGAPGSFTVTTNGSPAPGITESGPLPSGVTFTDNGNGSGTLSGTPHASGPFSVAFTATSGLGTVSQSFTLNVNVGPNLAPSITSGNTKTFVVGAAGSFIVTTNGSPVPVITESAPLPAGVTFTDNGNGTATLSGTPLSGGAFAIIITAANGVGPNAVQNFNLNVTGESITSANNTTFALGTPGSFTVTTSGSPTPAITESGALPTGVTFADNGNGTATLNGTPAAGGPFPIAFTAANGVGMNAVQNFILTVNQGPSFTSANTATFVFGTPGSFTVTTTGTPAPPIFEQGALPTGVTFVDNGNGSGTLSGTPGSSGIFNIGFGASNSGGKASQTFTLTVNAGGQAPVITSANNATFAVGSAGSFTVTTTGSPLPGITESGPLPTGVTFVDNGNGSGTLSGTPGTGGTFSISFTANNGVNPNTVQTFVLTVSQTQNIVFTSNAPPSAAVNSNFTVAASASSGLAVSFTASGSCSNVGATYTMTSSTGTCSVIANQAGNSTYPAAPQITQTVNATLPAQTITFAPIGTQMVGLSFPLNATASSGLGVTFTGACVTIFGGQATPLISGPCTIVASQSGNDVFAAATPVSQTFNVNGQPQTITFSPIATQTVGAPLTLTATASSGLAVTYTSSTTGICTVSGTTATFQTGGTCTIVASQAGISAFNASYAAATPVTQSFTVNQTLQSQTIAFGPIAAKTEGTPLTLTATATSGLPVSFTSSTTGICTVSGTTATLIAGGTCTIVASQAGNAGFSAATPVSQSFTVNLATQTIAFGPIAAQAVSTPLALTATASSGLPVTYTSSTTGVCTVSPTTATFLTVGTCTIVASQAGNAGFSAATPVSQSFTVSLGTQTIAFGPIAAQTVPTPLALTATASSGLPVTYTSSTTGVCTVSPTTATFLAVGTCTIVASQAGNAGFSAATPVSQSFTVSLGTQTISFGAIATQAGGTLTLTATASSGLPVTYTSSTTGVCTVSSATATFLTSGTCTIVASQAGNAAYAAATPMTQSFLVNLTLQPQSITFIPIPGQTIGTNLTLTATASSGLPVTYTSTTTGVCTISSTTAALLTGGTCTMVASQTGSAAYAPATSVTQSFLVSLQSQTITFPPIGTQMVGLPFPLNATASSGLAVTFNLSVGTCTLFNGQVTPFAAGTCTIVASQPGNGVYSAAAPVSRTFTVNGQPQTINFNAIAAQTVGAPLTLTATASSSLAVMYTSLTTGICTVSATTATFLTGGTCTIVASQAGNASYASATSVTQSFVVKGSLQPQSITFTTNAPANVAYNTRFTVAAGASSGLPVAFTSSGSCTNVGATYTMISATGMCSVIANQAGNANFSAAPALTRTVTATLASQTIAFPPIPTQNGPGTVTLAATASSVLPVTYTVNSGPATVSGNLLTTTGAGSVKVTASQAGSTNYSAAAPVSETFTVNANASTLNGKNCNGAYTGTFNGNLTVSAGQTCSFTDGGVNGNLTLTGGSLVLNNNSSINGNLQMSGGSLSISNVDVGGDLQIGGGGTFSIGSGVTIAGNLELSNLTSSAGTDQVCGSKIRGNLQLQNSAASVLIGAATGCAGNQVSGNLQVQNNTASTTIDSNTVSGNLMDQDNTAATQVFTNVVTGQLQCSGNRSITGGGNNAMSKEGQCSAF